MHASNFLRMCGLHTMPAVYMKEAHVSAEEGEARCRAPPGPPPPLPRARAAGTYALNRGLLGNLWSTYICFCQCIYLHFDRVVGICLKQRRQISRELRAPFRGGHIFSKGLKGSGTIARKWQLFPLIPGLVWL